LRDGSAPGIEGGSLRTDGRMRIIVMLPRAEKFDFSLAPDVRYEYSAIP